MYVKAIVLSISILKHNVYVDENFLNLVFDAFCCGIKKVSSIIQNVILGNVPTDINEASPSRLISIKSRD